MKRRLCFSLAGLLSATLLIVGCGGGGGGHKNGGTGVLSLTFVGEAGSATGPVGTSHKIVVYRTDGSIVDTQTVDTSSGTMQLTLSGLPSGTLRLHAGLSATAGGAEIGSVDTTFEGGTAPAPMQFAMRKTVTSASLTPASPTVNVGAIQTLFATGKSSDGGYVYTAPTDWTWASESPGFATVDTTGVVTGVAEGGSSISATHTASGKSATDSVGVLSTTVRRGKWTVMVFVNAANNLYEAAVDNVNQMERIANNPDVRFVIQWKQIRNIPSLNSNPLFSGTRRYLATYDSMGLTNVNQAIKSTMVEQLPDTDMGSYTALADFVSWSKSKYPADHYALVLWDHGAGWYSTDKDRARRIINRSISYDDQTGNFMTMPEVRQALTGQHLDILAYDSCLMQGAEDLIEVADKADYIIGSEENTPGPGYPYNTVFKPMVDNPDAPIDTLTDPFVTAFQARYLNDVDWKIAPLHQSVLDTSKVSTFQLALENFSLALINAPGGLGQLANNIRASSTGIASSDGYSYYDLDQICEKAASLSSNANVVTMANNLRTAIANMTVHTGTNTKGSFMKGISIEFGRASKMNSSYGARYGDLRIASLTHWDDFLKDATLNPPLPN